MVAKMLIALLVVVVAIRTARSFEGDVVRLVNDRANANEGRLEVLYNGTWGVVCASKYPFSYTSADVACKQLGYASAAVIRTRASYYYGTVGNKTRAWLDNVKCSGRETSLALCSSDGWGVTRCLPNDYIGLQCNLLYPVKPLSMPVRLSCPTHNANGSCKVCPDKRGSEPGDCVAQPAAEGVVEAFYNSRWRPVTSKGWNLNSANVVCGELGYPLALGIPTMQELWPNFDGSACNPSDANDSFSECNASAIAENNAYRSGLLSVYLQPLTCTGVENRLLDCYFPAFGPASNPSLVPATVRCGFQPHQSCGGSLNEVCCVPISLGGWGGGGGSQVLFLIFFPRDV